MLKLFSPLTRINYSFIFFKYSSHSSGVRDVIIAIDNEMIKNAVEQAKKTIVYCDDNYISNLGDLSDF